MSTSALIAPAAQDEIATLFDAVTTSAMLSEMLKISA
jgi:hypothetical protein